jgi:hypothetical protein
MTSLQDELNKAIEQASLNIDEFNTAERTIREGFIAGAQSMMPLILTLIEQRNFLFRANPIFKEWHIVDADKEILDLIKGIIK